MRASSHGGNPRWAWMNARKADLAALHLDREEFDRRMAQHRMDYDLDPLIQLAAKDQWMVQQQQRKLDRLSAVGREQADALARRNAAPGGSYGPWGIGDSHWALSEENLQNFLSAETKQGGMWTISEQHRALQANQSLIGLSQSLSAVAELGEILPHETPCMKKHPGICKGAVVRDDGELAWRAANIIADGFHRVRPHQC